MVTETLSTAALALPGSYMTVQWRGAHVFKVGTPKTFKMFAIIAPQRAELSVKLRDADSLELLIAADVGRRHTHLLRGNWVTIDLTRIVPDDAADRIAQSYDIVLSGLPKRIRASL